MNNIGYFGLLRIGESVLRGFEIMIKVKSGRKKVGSSEEIVEVVKKSRGLSRKSA